MIALERYLQALLFLSNFSKKNKSVRKIDTIIQCYTEGLGFALLGQRLFTALHVFDVYALHTIVRHGR